MISVRSNRGRHSCPHAMALWQAMRETWELPTQDELHDAEPDWLFRLLEKTPKYTEDGLADDYVEDMVCTK